MRNKLFILFLLLGISFNFLSAQNSDDTLKKYQKEFLYGKFEEKYHILKKASSEYPDALKDLSVQGLKFLIDNWEIVKEEKSLNNFSIIIMRNLSKEAARSNAENILKLFNLNKDTDTRIEIMKVIAKYPVKTSEIVDKLNLYLEELNASNKEDSEVDHDLVFELVKTLGRLESASSYKVLFACLNKKYSETISKQVMISLSLLEGDLKDKILDTIINNSFNDKLAALTMAEENPVLSDTAKAGIAEKALSVVVQDGIEITDENSEAIANIRYKSADLIRKYKWSKATKSIIKYFNISLHNYDKELIKTEDLIKVINTLGSVGSSEASFRLNQYLTYINATTKEKSPVDDSIIIAVIRNLGLLGDRLAFDSLLNIRFLNYSEEIKKEAELALQEINF